MHESAVLSFKALLFSHAQTPTLARGGLMLPLKQQIDPHLDDISTRAETMLRWKHVLVRRRLMRPPPPVTEKREIYQASFYPRPGDQKKPRPPRPQ